MAKQNYQNEVIKETVEVSSSVLTGAVGMWQESFLLSEADYVRLKTGEPKTAIWANKMLMMTIALAINIIAKLLSFFIENNERSTIDLQVLGKYISKVDWFAFVIFFLVTTILYGIGALVANERKSVMNKIGNHFEKASHQLFEVKK